MPNNISLNTHEISYYADRFICGGEALKQHRTVSRKRLALVELFNDYPDKYAQKLSKEIQAYRNAKQVIRKNNILNKQVLLTAHACFTHSGLTAGSYRKTQGFIGESLHNAVYIPPAAADIESRMNTWFAQASRKIEHYAQIIELYVELLAIHPFEDANGRVARALCDVWCERLSPTCPPLALYKLGKDPEHARAGYQAFGIRSNEGITHSYWQSLLSWRSECENDVQAIINEGQSNLKKPFALTPLTHNEQILLEYLWQQPVICPEHLQIRFNWDKNTINKALSKLQNAEIITTKRLKNYHNKTLFSCEPVFLTLNSLDRYFLTKTR